MRAVGAVCVVFANSMHCVLSCDQIEFQMACSDKQYYLLGIRLGQIGRAKFRENVCPLSCLEAVFRRLLEIQPIDLIETGKIN